jgi:hypothetical protein
MKQCRRCGRSYTDEWKYCLQDGTVLDDVYDGEATVSNRGPETSSNLPPTIAATYTPPGYRPPINNPVRENGRPVWPFMIGGLLALLLVGLGMSLLLRPRPTDTSSGKGPMPQASATPWQTAASPKTTPSPVPTPTIDLVDIHKPSLISAIRLADNAESDAGRNLNPSPLYNGFKGEALKAELAGLDDLRSKGIYRDSRLEDQDFESFDVSSDAKRATVRVVEMWSTDYYNARTGQCISTVPSHKVPQTVYLEQGSKGWIVNNIIYDKLRSDVKPLPCASNTQ